MQYLAVYNTQLTELSDWVSLESILLSLSSCIQGSMTKWQAYYQHKYECIHVKCASQYISKPNIF